MFNEIYGCYKLTDMKKHYWLSVLKEPIPLFLLLMNILMLLIILYLCYTQLLPENPYERFYPYESPENTTLFPEDFPV